MTLRDWLAAEGLSNAEFGRRIGRTAETVRRYAAAERIPDKETMPLIVRETGGAVTPNDFFDITLPPAALTTATVAEASPTETPDDIRGQEVAA